jgi:hypothetical protein
MQLSVQTYNLLMYKKLYDVKYLRCNGNGHWGVRFWIGDPHLE